MKLASYRIHGGVKSFGVVVDGGVVDVGSRLGGYADIKSLLALGEQNALQEFLRLKPDYGFDELSFLPVVENPTKIFCVGMNYSDKRQEFGATESAPTLFVRFADTQVGHECDVQKPHLSDEFDYEGELAVVIGKSGFRIDEASALDYVAGYSCYMDGSVRDWQHTWFTAGKNWKATGCFGPWLVTADEISNPHELGIRTFLNGVQVQCDNTANMIHKIPALLAYISTFSELSAGDVIITGSPGGVGKKRVPPLFLQDGDVIEVEIDRIGRLRNRVREEVEVLAA